MATQQIAAKTPGSAATVPINAHSSLGMDNVTCCAILTPVCMMAMTVFPPTVRHPALKRKWVVDHNSIDSYYDLDTWETTEYAYNCHNIPHTVNALCTFGNAPLILNMLIT